MNRNTYIIGKCAVILSEILEKEFNKFHHNNTQEKVNNFMKNIEETMERKVFLHLNMNRMDNFHIINMDSDYELTNDGDYFFFKIDGLDNFSRGINNYSIMTGIIMDGHLINWTCFIPMVDKTLWFQEEDNCIYINNTICWSNNSVQRTSRKTLVYTLDGCSYDKNLLEKIIPYFFYNNIYDWFLLMNDNSDAMVMINKKDKIMDLIIHTFQSLGALNIENKDNYKIITKQLLINKLV